MILRPPARQPFRRSTARGFTLIEMLISAALMAVLLGAAYACLRAGLDSRKIIEPRADTTQTGRVVLDLLAADLRSACPLHKGPEFLGMKRQLNGMQADNLDFATHHFTPRHPGEGDYCSVSWYVERDPTTGDTHLWRRRNPSLSFDPLSGGNRDEIASGIRGLQFEYYDGLEWYDTWGDPQGQVKKENSLKDRPNLTGLPEAVRITLQIESEPGGGKKGQTTPAAESPTDGASDVAPPLTFQTVIRLNLAGLPSAGASGSASTPGNGTPGPGGPGGPQGLNPSPGR